MSIEKQGKGHYSGAMNQELRQQQERRKPDEYFGGSRRYVEAKTGLTVVNVHAGDCFVSDNPNDIAATILGSCIAACIHDPIAKIGGMNHFLLPGSERQDSDSARFGAFAMEQLINEIMKRGGVKARMEAKLFGGGNVIKSSALIGDKNAHFATEYLRKEGIKIAGQDIGDVWPRKVRYSPANGKAMMRKLKRDDDFANVQIEEEGYRKQIQAPAMGNDVDLF